LIAQSVPEHGSTETMNITADSNVIISSQTL
jgi:hypothetical protein